MKSFLVDAFFYLLFALIGVGVGSALIDYNAFDRIRFWIRPVVVMQGELVEKEGDRVLIHMYGKKLRGVECEYKGIQAFGDRINGLPVDLSSNRIDKPITGATKDSGSYDIGVWEVFPVKEVYRVRVNVAHECGKSRVSTEIASINLEGK